ncbi:hypothetical protein E2C01_042696 [Portunus trituberculatus]|uniref:Uncharacterized protein n=1 Tax=Portunus trituberculatus TaxID=210409 RepID=A0A5B7FMG0_PORTR|nr:hypothetical protein [Portunus trituberculatus]
MSHGAPGSLLSCAVHTYASEETQPFSRCDQAGRCVSKAQWADRAAQQRANRRAVVCRGRCDFKGCQSGSVCE